jgi:uncharacterized protein (TIGR03083 family)
MDHWDAIADERLALAAQLDGLTPEQWATQSLCEAWTVRDVVAHLVSPHSTLAMPRFLVAFARSRGNFDRASEALTAHQARREPAALVADLRRCANGHFAPPGFGSVAPLTDILVHGCDVRIPLALADERPVERWLPVLDFVVTDKARRGFVARRLPDVRFEATDVDWAHGTGLPVRGPAWAIALAILGRGPRPEELTGAGAPTLREWAGI